MPSCYYEINSKMASVFIARVGRIIYMEMLTINH